jgi:hypothetical protein
MIDVFMMVSDDFGDILILQILHAQFGLAMDIKLVHDSVDSMKRAIQKPCYGDDRRFLSQPKITFQHNGFVFPMTSALVSERVFERDVSQALSGLGRGRKLFTQLECFRACEPFGIYV